MHPLSCEARIHSVTKTKSGMMNMNICSTKRSACAVIGLTAAFFVTSCSQHTPPPVTAISKVSDKAEAEPDNLSDPCELALAPHQGADRIDLEILRQQANVRAEKNTLPSLERLGWLFVAKARASFDPGYYKLAEQCALCLESRQPHSAEALLLRGHVLENLHRFKEAEAIAHELVGRRGFSFDYGLLGDTLMEQGNLQEAAEAYQAMVDAKPDLEAYARIAHLRWLKGDVAGAAAVMQLAVSAASPASPEAAAWVNTRLALLQFQQGKLEEAAQTCAVALDYQHEYPPALLLQGRLLLAEGRNEEAVTVLQRAAQLNPLPDYQWVLSEALRAAQRHGDAAAIEAALAQQGEANDPRTFALYLASRGETPEFALQLARAELETRSDVFTHDALAWSLIANGQIDTAQVEMEQALSQGTKDARLFLHAGVIAAKAAKPEQAQRWLAKAAPMMPLLLPSEQKLWRSAAADLGETGPQAAASDTP
jgi:tetratricopeptide (TPR) repeat protein